MITTLLLAAAVSATPVAPKTPVHLGISLRLTHLAELEQLKRDQQDPKSPAFRQWLTPAQFGARFGQSAETYQQLAQWLRAAGLTVTEAPNRAFIEALGTADQVQKLLKVKLNKVEGQPDAVHTLAGPATLPAPFDKLIINISGLDTRFRFHHHLAIGGNIVSFGPQDLRHEYNSQPLLDQGYTGQGLKTAVLSTAETQGNGASPAAITWFFQNISDSKATLVQDIIPNPMNDFDPQQGAGIEFDLDTEMHSVGVPGADSIILVVSPASEVFTTGAQHIANALSDVAAVSISLGICEPAELANIQQTHFDEMMALRQSVIQGVMEGQTWAAASGDNGADDCRNGSGAAVDFPSDIPEMIAAGGSEVKPSMWDANSAVATYQQEVTWNDGTQGGAAGGGVSSAYLLTMYQSNIGLQGTGRLMPDIALIAGNTGVAISYSEPPGPLGPVLGTSVASPLSAGMFALVASRMGCRLGDLHTVLYQLGADQSDGGIAVFHDITSGNLTYNGVTGPIAGPGFDRATGWGSLDVAALAAALPGCPNIADAGIPDAGLTPYEACAFAGAGCAPGCLTIPEGPSTCEVSCTLGDAGCASGTVCNGDSIFAMGNLGLCVPGCATQADCASQAGTVCSLCAQVCVPQGNDTNTVGGTCGLDSDCPSGAFCYTGRGFNGYCTYLCQPGVASTDACACPSATECGTVGRFNKVNICLNDCGYPGEACARSDMICQPQDTGSPACLPHCTIRTTMSGMMFDSCASIGTSLACDLDSGVCGGPQSAPDAGVDAGVDAGSDDAGTMSDGGSDAGMQMMQDSGTPDGGDNVNPPKKSGCGCNAAGPLPFALGIVLLALRRRK